MSGCRHPLTNFTLLLLLFLLYAVYPIPFIMTNDFEYSEDFLLIDTCGACATLITAAVGNILCLVIFVRLKNAAKYLYILMAISDLLQPFFYLPGKLKQNWEHYWYFVEHDNQKLISSSEERFLNHYYSIRHGLAVFSIISYSLICILDFYTAANKVKKDKLTMTVKGPTVFLSVKISVFLGWLYYVNIRNDWNKAVALAVLSYFIPIVVCTICLFLSQLIRNFVNSSISERLVIHQPSYKFMWTLWLSYVIFYTPWFMWSCKNLHENIGGTHAMNMLMLMKACSNVFLLIEFDNVLKGKLKTMMCDSYNHLTSLLRNKCCCCCGTIVGYVTTSRERIREKISLAESNTFVVVETTNGITLQNGSNTSRSVVSAV